MSRRAVSGCFAIVAVLIGLISVAIIVGVGRRRAAEEGALAEQFRLAQAEGIPTSWQAFAATIKSAPASENAARFYEEISARHFDSSKSPSYLDSTKLPKLEGRLILRTSSEALTQAKSILAGSREEVGLLTQATTKPRCWFNRDWSKGPGVLFREYAPMKYGAKLLALAGSVDAAEHHPGNAIKRVQQILQISKHIGEEGTQISILVRESIYLIGLNHLALWSYAFPEELSY